MPYLQSWILQGKIFTTHYAGRNDYISNEAAVSTRVFDNINMSYINFGLRFTTGNLLDLPRVYYTDTEKHCDS